MVGSSMIGSPLGNIGCRVGSKMVRQLPHRSRVMVSGNQLALTEVLSNSYYSRRGSRAEGIVECAEGYPDSDRVGVTGGPRVRFRSLVPRPGIEPGLEVPETSVMSFSLPGRAMKQMTELPQRCAADNLRRGRGLKQNRG